MRLSVQNGKTKGQYRAVITFDDGSTEVLGSSYKSTANAQSALRMWLLNRRQ